MNSSAESTLAQMLCFSVYSAEREIRAVYRELLSPWNLSYTQYLVLLALWSDDTLSVSDLGRLLGLDSGTLSPLLKRMEREGLVERTRRTDDERGILVSLTHRGVELREELDEVPACFIERIDITLQEIVELRDRTRSLVAALNRVQEKPATTAGVH